jgi:hypothetical protein
MRAIVVLPFALLAACSQPAAVNNTAADVNTAADRAQNDIDSYAANGSAAATPAPLNPAKPGPPGGRPHDRTPIAEGPITPDSAQAAANIVQTYYALIESKRYVDAWALWGDKGKDSGQSVDAFVAGFDKYSEYHANIGAPGRVDSGAGQRYVTVPVQAYARLKDGTAAYWLGSAVLHRTGDIDGATAEDKAWRIKSIDLKPAPPAAK